MFKRRYRVKRRVKFDPLPTFLLTPPPPPSDDDVGAGSFRRRRRRLYRMGVEYQQDHSVEVPVDRKKFPLQLDGYYRRVLPMTVFNTIQHTDDRIQQHTDDRIQQMTVFNNQPPQSNYQQETDCLFL